MVALSSRTDKPARSPQKRSNPIEEDARRTLEDNQLFRCRARLIRIDEHDGCLVLKGQLPSFYLKQMLQTLLKQVDGVTQIDNQVDVDWPPENS